tara:strand:+ start:862 stop:1425 length:564 start_codon:yes stop_codon:yes gene_type:complete
MNNQILVIYDFDELFKIMNELQNILKFKIKKALKNNLDDALKDKNSNFLVITKDEILKAKNVLILNKFPIRIVNLIEKINIEFIKLKFNQQSVTNVGKYNIDLNSREMILEKKVLRLTEKECEIIIYLSKSNKPVPVSEFEENVWDYQSKLETHTVETHIYRLRKKIFEKFNDENFLISEKNGYQIK